jgi:hypothetical protein
MLKLQVTVAVKEPLKVLRATSQAKIQILIFGKHRHRLRKPGNKFCKQMVENGHIIVLRKAGIGTG